MLDTWLALEPCSVHPPMPVLILRAMVGTSVTWGWYHMAALLLIAFYGLLRPCEFLSAKLNHIMWPEDHQGGHHIFLQVMEPKTRARGPHHQHVKIDEGLVVDFLQNARQHWRQDGYIWPGSARAFQKRFKMLVASVCGSEHVVLPSSLRPGGATFVFEASGEDLLRTMWRGRWQQPRMLGHYVQQLGCVRTLQKLPPPHRSRLDEWNAIFFEVISSCWHGQSGPPNPPRDHVWGRAAQQQLCR